MLAPTPYFSDRGCHVRIYEEAKALQSLGIDVRIVTYHLGRDMANIPTYRSCKIPWYKKFNAGPSWHKPYLDILLYFKAARLAKTFAPDLIHAHLHEGALVGYFLKKKLKIPMIFDYQGGLTAEIFAHGFLKKDSLLLKCFAALEIKINRMADFIITSSSQSASTLVHEWQLPVNMVQALMDGVDIDTFRPHDRAECGKALQIPQDVPLVAFLGLLNQYQGIDLLLDAILILKRRNQRIHFLVMGFPEQEYVKKSKQLAIESMITFTGRVDYGRAAEYLSACDMAVSPKISLSEANGKLFNYMACGLPTVVFETPVNREILGEAGVYAEYADAEDLAAKIAMLVHDANQMQLLSAKVREKAVREHAWLARGEILIRLYHGVLQQEIK